jgi:hypothetical protein
VFVGHAATRIVDVVARVIGHQSVVEHSHSNGEHSVSELCWLSGEISKLNLHVLSLHLTVLPCCGFVYFRPGRQEGQAKRLELWSVRGEGELWSANCTIFRL